MINEPGHSVINLIRDFYNMEDISYDFLKNLISNIVDIITKRLPSEVNFNPTKLDSVIHKIKLVPIPKSIVEEDVTESSYYYDDYGS